jgi:RND family efflux transporter MFP subunit
MMNRANPVRGAAAATLSLIAAAMLAGCQQPKTETANGAEAEIPPVFVGPENVAVAESTKIATGPSISGSLVPKRSATVRAEIGGAVLALPVEQGQRVEQGQLIARLDDVGIQDAFLSARSGVTAAQNALDVAKREEDRATKLLAAGAIAERELDLAKRAVISAQAQFTDAQARLALAQQQVAKTRILAPFTGIVSDRPASAGDIVAPGTPIATIVDATSMELEASVPAEELGSVRVNLPVTFTLSGYPSRTFQGRISRVNPVADPATRQVRVYAELAAAGTPFVSGLFATGRIAAQSRSGITVPESAVDESGLSPTVLRVKGGKTERVEVKIGLRDAALERIELTSGIAAGDTVLIGAATGVSPGAVIRVGGPERSGGD